MKPKRKRDFTGMFIMAVLLSFILPLGYLVVRIVSHGGGTEEVRSREDYVLMLLQCLLGIAAIVLPLRLIRQKTLQIPRVMLVLYIAFLYCAIFLGEVRSFYYAVPHWDTILHTMSGAMLGALGFSMIAIFNNAERIPLNLSPVFIAVFAFCFALAMGAVWEIYEFTMDSVFGTNMQKYMLDNGTALIGQAALQDTMKDMHIVQEMYARGYDFLPLDLYQADARRFKIIDGKLMPALSTIEGLGEKAADAVMDAAKEGKFLSKDDFRDRTKVSKTVIDLMDDLGILGDLPESNQLSLFDLVG